MRQASVELQEMHASLQSAAISRSEMRITFIFALTFLVRTALCVCPRGKLSGVHLKISAFEVFFCFIKNYCILELLKIVVK